MKEIMYSSDYHDYVFRDGKFIGEFDRMYKYANGIPWHQDKTAYSVFSNIDISILKQYNYGTVCDVGCGLGYFINRLYRELNSSGKKIRATGIDISQTAINKANILFPEIRFIKSDLLKERPLKGEHFDLVVIKEIIWYVSHKIDRFLENCVDLIKKKGLLYISQSFPQTDKWVGKEVIDSPETLMKILLKFIKPAHYCTDWNRVSCKNGHLHFLGHR